MLPAVKAAQVWPVKRRVSSTVTVAAVLEQLIKKKLCSSPFPTDPISSWLDVLLLDMMMPVDWPWPKIVPWRTQWWFYGCQGDAIPTAMTSPSVPSLTPQPAPTAPPPSTPQPIFCVALRPYFKPKIAKYAPTKTCNTAIFRNRLGTTHYFSCYDEFFSEINACYWDYLNYLSVWTLIFVSVPVGNFM